MSAVFSFTLLAVGAATSSCAGNEVCLLQLRRPHLALARLGRSGQLSDEVLCPSRECVITVPLRSRWRVFGNGSCPGTPCQGLRNGLIPEEAPPCQNLVPKAECSSQRSEPQLICPSGACVLSKPKEQRYTIFEANCAQSPCSYMDLGPEAPHCHRLVELSVCNGHLAMNTPVSPVDDDGKRSPAGNTTDVAPSTETTTS